MTRKTSPRDRKADPGGRGNQIAAAGRVRHDRKTMARQIAAEIVDDHSNANTHATPAT